jgi:hypothetical protein
VEVKAPVIATIELRVRQRVAKLVRNGELLAVDWLINRLERCVSVTTQPTLPFLPTQVLTMGEYSHVAVLKKENGKIGPLSQ